MQLQLCENLDSVHQFLLGPATEENLCTPTRLSLLDVLEDKFRKEMLRLQLLINVEFGRPLVKATYMLEGDGATALFAYDIIAGIESGFATAAYPLTRAHSSVVADVAGNVSAEEIYGQALGWVQHARQYFHNNFLAPEGQRNTILQLFKQARLFLPWKVCNIVYAFVLE